MLLSITSFCMSDRLNSKSFKDKEMNSGKPWSCVRFGVKKRIEMRGKFLTFFLAFWLLSKILNKYISFEPYSADFPIFFLADFSVELRANSAKG